MSEHLLLGLATIIVLGIVAQWLAWRLHLPAILLLLIFCIVAGPVSGILNPDELFGDLLFPLVLDLVNKQIFSLNDAIASLTSKPAAILDLDTGTLSPGRAADIAIIDLQRHFNVDRNQLLSAGKNTPFHGWELHGLVTEVLFNGRMVYQCDAQ